MKREWKPGDVAMVNDCTRPDAPWEPATCTKARGDGEREAEWLLHKTGGRAWSSVSLARPLVVIDPEDREQVERFAVALHKRTTPVGNFGADGYSADEVQAALREFANPTPPKPDEPTGLGAVVEDAEGCRFVRVAVDRLPWVTANEDGRARDYDQITAVRVLSEGVTE